MPAHCLTHNGSSQHTYFTYFSVESPFPHYCIRLSCRNFSLPLPISLFPSRHFAVCVILDIRKHALKTQKKSLIPHFCGTIFKRNNFKEAGTPAEFCKTLVFQFISNSNPLKHSSTETKYCEFIPAVGLTIWCISGTC